MKVGKYWAHESKSVQDPGGKWMKLAIWQCSDQDTAHASQQALARVQDLVSKVVNGETLNRYLYGERPLREEILNSLAGDRGREAGVITRNAYGAAVLNAANAMFLDIDFDEENPAAAEPRALARIEQWVAQHGGLGMRIYRTTAGLRGLITNELFEPTQQSALQILRELECDPLYIRLCRDQGCFRARLSAKPWRCGIKKPPYRFPWENSRAEQEFRAWEARYKAAASQYAACRLVRQVGNPEIHPEIAQVLAVHDELTRSQSKLPLA